MPQHDELVARAITEREKRKAKAKVNYAYARKLGFNSYEAGIMANEGQ